MIDDVPAVRVTGRVHPRIKGLIKKVTKRYPRLSEGRQVAAAMLAYEPQLKRLSEGKAVTE